MAYRQRNWAREWTKKLRSILGGKCNYCGLRERLEFDLIHPIDTQGKHHKMEWSWRLSFYRKQHTNQNLQLLCQKCNGKKGNNLELSNYEEIEQPF